MLGHDGDCTLIAQESAGEDHLRRPSVELLVHPAASDSHRAAGKPDHGGGSHQSDGQEYGSTGFGDLRATEVMEFFGTNAIPFLLRKLEGRDSAIEKGVTAAASKAGINSLPFRNAELERSQAVTGLICLKTLPQDALHLIATLSTNSEPEIAGAASYVLKRCSATRRDNTHR